MNLEGGNVIGVGVDLTEVARIRSAHEKHGATFLDKVFTPAEQALCLAKANPYPSLAARFAAKEAVSKAFGTGLGAELHLTSVSVLHGPEEGPLVVLDDKASALLASQGGTRVLVSLMHTDDLAQVFAVIVRSDAGRTLTGSFLRHRLGLTAFDAVVAAVTWHAQAADLLREQRGEEAIRTTELLPRLSQVLRPR